MLQKDCRQQLLADEKIEKIYDDIYDIVKIELFNKKCQSDNEKIVSLNLFNKDDKLNDSEIKRIFYSNYEFRGREGSGKVAFHDIFFLKDKYKSIGLAKKIHEKEKEIYKNNSIQQIHLNPMSDGVIVWAKLGYLYLDRESEIIINQRFFEYLEEIKSIEDEEYDKLMDIFYDEDENFLTNQWSKVDKKYFFADGKDSFTDWLYFEPHSRENELIFKMYKNLEEVA